MGMGDRRTSSRRRTQKRCDPKHAATFHGLQHWYKALFERLGWMVLAKSIGGMDEKIVAYKQSVHHLKRELACKMRSIKNADQKRDLEIMYKHACVLMDHVNADFP